MTLYITLVLFISLLLLSFPSPIFVLFILSSSLLWALSGSYNLTTFSSFSLDTCFFICDEFSGTLIFIIVFVIYYSFVSHLSSTSGSESNYKSFSLLWLLVLISLSALAVFSSTSLLVIYVGYEISLVPILLIIFLWGSYPERSYAAMTMLLYTLIFSLPLIAFFSVIWSSDLFLSNYFLISYSHLNSQGLLMSVWPVLVFMAFAVKLPIYGLHSWLPIAHVEAPTFGSMILAGLLLNLGGCGLYRFSLFMPGLFGPVSKIFLAFLVVSILVSALVCSIQSDLNRLIAYSSVVHITSVGVLFLLDSSIALCSSLILIVLHGASSPLMFNIVGQLYSCLNTRLLIMIRSINSFFPFLYLSMIITFYLTVPVPPSLTFLGELYLFSSLLNLGWIVFLISGLYLFVAIIFNLLWLTTFFGSSGFCSPFESLAQKIIPFSMSLLGLSSVFMLNSMFI